MNATYHSQLDKVWLTEESLDVRKNFAKKVLGQVFCMLGITAGICALGYTAPQHTQAYLLGPGQWLLWLSFMVAMFLLLSYHCHPSWFYDVPQKYLTLTTFTASMGTMTMYGTMKIQQSTLLLGVGLVAAITLFLLMYVHWSSQDFTVMGGALGSFLWLLLIFGLLQIWFHDRILQLVYASAGALLFSLYIMYDFSLILGGKHRKHQFSTDDDVLASISLFLDILNLFLFILDLLSGNGDR